MQRHKILAGFTLALLALLPLVAFAEPGDRFRHHGGRGMFPPPGYLDLSEEQIAAAESIRDSVRAEMAETRDGKRTLHEQLKAALDGENPDAAAVGQLVIELHGLREQTRATLEDAESRFAEILTAEQLEKWENFKELRQGRREQRRGGPFGDGPGAGFGRGPGQAGPIG